MRKTNLWNTENRCYHYTIYEREMVEPVLHLFNAGSLTTSLIMNEEEWQKSANPAQFELCD